MKEQNLPGVLAWYLLPHLTRQVATEGAAKAAVDELIDARKPDFVKMVVDALPPGTPRIDPKVAAAISKAANAKGVRTVAHIGTTTDAIDAAEAGIAAWIHGVYKEPIADADVTRIVKFGIPMAPTLIVFDSYAELGFERREATKLEKEMIPEAHLRSFDAVPADFEIDPGLEELVGLLQARREGSIENVRRLHEAGVTILAGSDAQPGVFHGPGLHRELRLLERAGLSRIDVIRAATLHAARFFTQKDDPPFGVVAAGKEADLLLVRGDPLEDLSALERIEEVIVRGVPLIRTPLAAPQAKKTP
jgi:imidazolonepropionase-like amidohydrolase